MSQGSKFFFKLLFAVAISFNCRIVFAKDYPVLRLMQKDNFVMPLTEFSKPGTKIYIYNKDDLQAYGTIVKCKKTACMAQVTKKKPNFNFQRSMLIRFTPRPKKLPSDEGIYGGSGGTLGFGIQIGYWKNYNKDLRLEGAFEYLSTQLANIALSGYGAAAGLQYTYFRYGNFSFPFFVRTSAMMITLDFSAVNSEGYVTPSNLIFSFEAGQSVSYQLSDTLSFSAGLGLSYNTFSALYTDKENETQYSAPFAGLRPTVNFYGSYRF